MRKPGYKPSFALAAAVSTAAIVLLWKLLSLSIGKDIILPAPETVAGRLFALLASPGFLASLGATALRGAWAFAIACGLGTAIGFLSGNSPLAKAFFSPVMTVLRATPVLAIVLIALLWFGADNVPVFSAVLMALPIVATSVEEGIAALDRHLVEMGRIYGFSKASMVRNVYAPGIAPFIASGAANALGLCWKVVVAGEVLSQPEFAVGTEMQEARALLETTDVFAWALVAILLCGSTEALFRLVKRSMRSHGYAA